MFIIGLSRLYNYVSIFLRSDHSFIPTKKYHFSCTDSRLLVYFLSLALSLSTSSSVTPPFMFASLCSLTSSLRLLFHLKSSQSLLSFSVQQFISHFFLYYFYTSFLGFATTVSLWFSIFFLNLKTEDSLTIRRKLIIRRKIGVRHTRARRKPFGQGFLRSPKERTQMDRERSCVISLW